MKGTVFLKGGQTMKFDGLDEISKNTVTFEQSINQLLHSLAEEERSHSSS